MATDILFSAPLTINGSTENYHVVFENESYRFVPEGGNGAPVLELRREKDEWHTDNTLDATTKAAAISVLDEYLLSQH